MKMPRESSDAWIEGRCLERGAILRCTDKFLDARRNASVKKRWLMLEVTLGAGRELIESAI